MALSLLSTGSLRYRALVQERIYFHIFTNLKAPSQLKALVAQQGKRAESHLCFLRVRPLTRPKEESYSKKLQTGAGYIRKIHC